MALHRREVRAALRAEMVQDGGQPVDGRLIRLHLAVEDAQRIGLDSPAAVRAERGSHFPQLLPQMRHEAGTALGATHGVDQQKKALEAGLAQNGNGQLDHFGVHRRRLRPDGFGADLIELPVAALLRPLAPEHRAHVEELHESGLLVEAMLDVGPHHRSRAFRPQREGGAVAVLERVHLFADDVGFFAHAAREQLRLLENRRADLVVIRGAKDFPRLPLDEIPEVARRRQNVPSPFDRANHGCSSL